MLGTKSEAQAGNFFVGDGIFGLKQPSISTIVLSVTFSALTSSRVCGASTSIIAIFAEKTAN